MKCRIGICNTPNRYQQVHDCDAAVNDARLTGRDLFEAYCEERGRMLLGQPAGWSKLDNQERIVWNNLARRIEL